MGVNRLLFPAGLSTPLQFRPGVVGEDQVFFVAPTVPRSGQRTRGGLGPWGLANPLVETHVEDVKRRPRHCGA